MVESLLFNIGFLSAWRRSYNWYQSYY